MADLPVRCENCGTHFVLDPGEASGNLACSECGGTRLFMNQPSPTQSDGTLRDMVDSNSQKDQGGNPLGEGTIMGSPAEPRDGKRDNYMHASISTQSVTERVEMRSASLNMDPYPVLWSQEWLGDTHIEKTAGPVLEALPELGSIAGRIAPTLMKGALLRGVPHAGEGGNQGGDQDTQNGGMAPDPISPAPGLQQLGGLDSLAMVLVADLETPHSVKSVGEQHDDPEDQDQKEFDDGDKDPSNLKNPNNEDSGANGEDNARSDAGFGQNSPGIERLMMVLPLLLHYFQSEDSGESDPIIKGLHDTLDSEKPGYLDQEDPEGHNLVQLVIKQHKEPHGVHAGVNALPGGLPAVPTPAGMGQQGGMGVCPSCGGTTTADGSCPQCGAKAAPQGGAAVNPKTQGMGAASFPPAMGHMANTVGPTTPEQKAAVIQLLIQQGRYGDLPKVELHPEQFAKEMAEIAQDPNVAPLVDPSQAAPAPMPPQGGPGAMPVMDPTQMGGGGNAQMQPMARRAADNMAPRCPKCQSATTGIRDGIEGDGQPGARCHSCGYEWKPSESKNEKGTPSYVQARVILTELANPLLENAAEQGHPHTHTDQGGLTWQDDQGSQLVEGQTYELSSPGYSIPDQVKVIYVHPDEVGLKLVGEFSNLRDDGDDSTPDIKISREQAEMMKYRWSPTNQNADDQNAGEQPLGGTPGLDQIPPSGPTTDEQAQSYPNTVAHATAALMDEIPEPMDEDQCRQCRSTLVEHVLSSASTTMHECYRCGSVWETHDDWEGREASGDLSWIYEDTSHGGSFFDEMERARSMYGGNQSRSLASAAAKDQRLQHIKEVLDSNREERMRTAGRHFTPTEQRALINERGTARNSDLLDLGGTHYMTRHDTEGKANGANVPIEHMFMGL